jgi:hypothetical protein
MVLVTATAVIIGLHRVVHLGRSPVLRNARGWLTTSYLRAPMGELSGDADTRTYMARLHTDGKSNKESMRCLKRQLSNVIFRGLTADLQKVGRAA